MPILSEKKYINLGQACRELDIDVDDLIDFWLSQKINLYYFLQDEKVKIKKPPEIDIAFNAYGYFLISPMMTTIRVEDTIKIITEEKVRERSNQELLTHGYCHIYTPDESDCLIFDEIDSIEGLEYPIEKLFISKADINKFIKIEV